MISRRKFLEGSAAVVCTLAMPFGIDTVLAAAEKLEPADIRGKIIKGDAPDKPWKWSREAFLYKKLKNGKTMCGVCPNHCVLSPGDRSVCRSKVNIKGTMYTLAYGNPCAVHVDPIEKKPLYHFHPGTKAFSLAHTGCSFRCLNCQNWEISQVRPEDVRTHGDLFPGQAVKAAVESHAGSIAFTYSEPTTYIEYMVDTAKLSHEKGLKNLWISNGYINPEPRKTLLKVLDAANVNLKAFDDGIYRKLNGGRLAPVLDTFKAMHEAGLHFEMTNLVVPGYVDKDDLVKRMCAWILENLGPDHPLHFLRFFPRYKLNRLAPTPVSTLTRFRKIAMSEGLRYVYVGNVPGHEGNNTYCHSCGKLLVERRGYTIPTYNIDNGKCRFCGTGIPGEWGDKKCSGPVDDSGIGKSS